MKIKRPENTKGALFPIKLPFLTISSWAKPEYSLVNKSLTRDLAALHAEGTIKIKNIANQFRLRVDTPILGSKHENSLLINSCVLV